MSYTLIIFPEGTPHCEYQHDAYPGTIFPGRPVVHPSGRPGIGFDIPDGTPARFGSTITIAWPEVTNTQRGITRLNDGTIVHDWTPGQQAAFEADDFRKPST